MKPRDQGEPEAVQSLREANEAFYRSFEALDMRGMSDAWLHADWARCTHAGWQERVGWDEIRESWEKIFASTQAIQFVITQVTAVALGDLGWVACTENIIDPAGEGISPSTAVATNLFVFDQGRWLMVLHHASHYVPA